MKTKKVYFKIDVVPDWKITIRKYTFMVLLNEQKG